MNTQFGPSKVDRAQRCLRLDRIDKGNLLLLSAATNHYTSPKGFVGRFLGYAIYFDEKYLGVIIGGSATLHLPGRNEFLGIEIGKLNSVINNTLFHIERPWAIPPFLWKFGENGISVIENREGYPKRNITNHILREWRARSAEDWLKVYGDEVVGFETLVLPPRTGEIYIRDAWTLIGETKGYICKREGGKSVSEKFGGKRVWEFDPSKKKLVFCKQV
jgi:hypothetical protein